MTNPSPQGPTSEKSLHRHGMAPILPSVILVVDAFGLRVEGLSLGRPPIDSHETSERQRLFRCCHGLVPALDVRVRLLTCRTGLLTDDLARRTYRQRRFRETTLGLDL